MLGLEAIGKNGYNSSIIIKTFERNVDEYNEFILNEIDKFDNEHPDYNVENDFDLEIGRASCRERVSSPV